MLQLVEVGRAFGQRPSGLLRMRESGYDDQTCLALDVAMLAFVQRFERMRDATKEVDAPRTPKKARPKMHVPKHTEEELLAVLGVDPEDTVAQEAVAASLADFDWDALEWGDEDGDEVGVDG